MYYCDSHRELHQTLADPLISFLVLEILSDTTLDGARPSSKEDRGGCSIRRKRQQNIID